MQDLGGLPVRTCHCLSKRGQPSRKIRSTRKSRKDSGFSQKDWFELPHCRADAFVPPQKCLDSRGKIPCRGATRRGNLLRFLWKYKLAERVGFEPTDPFRGQLLSRKLLSAAQPPLLADGSYLNFYIFSNAFGYGIPQLENTFSYPLHYQYKYYDDYLSVLQYQDSSIYGKQTAVTVQNGSWTKVFYTNILYSIPMRKNRSIRIWLLLAKNLYLL